MRALNDFQASSVSWVERERWMAVSRAVLESAESGFGDASEVEGGLGGGGEGLRENKEG